jgi:hypothetical protein
MDLAEERARGSPFTSDSDPRQASRTVPLRQTPIVRTSPPSPGDPMEVTTPTAATMGPPTRTSEESDTNGIGDHTDQPNSGNLAAGPNAAAAAAAGAQQPKVVQTAFIHKLYKYALPQGDTLHSC